jgi:hypothetical protein
MRRRALLFLALAAALARPAPAQNSGTIEFEAQVRPTGGRPEPARQLPVYLLRKSYAAILKEAEASAPRPDLDSFIEELSVSPELKSWMKRSRHVNLSGEDFMRKVKIDDLFAVPEFFDAFLARNAGDASVGFPSSKARDADRAKNPAKYEKDQAAYREALRKFAVQNPHAVHGIEVQLADINPGQKWMQREAERKRRVQRRALELAEASYLVARVETDLAGRGSFSGVAAGDYWISTLDNEAMAGDVRLRWDLPVPARPGRVTRLVLSNVNSVQSP